MSEIAPGWLTKAYDCRRRLAEHMVFVASSGELSARIGHRGGDDQAVGDDGRRLPSSPQIAGLGQNTCSARRRQLKIRCTDAYRYNDLVGEIGFAPTS